ncbi:bifunctional protein HldE [Skermanella aerolata]|uniref:Bifunctional protein HldE n=2 Tax=Skermanella aerolata TaxID=393310 RepID=A0A512E3F6_9PROT|nr:ADP-heptose synthase [Skermanella aerolata KACC 11604]GEO42990.1 bifunctional protein HldE [Skermanella aerolata]
MEEQALLQYKRKIKTAAELREVIGPHPREKKIIMCHGVFDIVHPGHLRHLLYAKSKADILVVSLTADEHITKGNTRPYVPEDLRAINLAAFEVVDYVIIDREVKPLANLQILQPNYFAKGYEYVKGAINPKTQEEIDVLDSYGGEMIFTPGDIVYSSSSLIELAPPKIAIEKLLMLMQGEGITFKNLRDTVAKMPGIRVHVLGDTIVDSYTQCSMIGGQTKTPTMSVRFERRQDFVGGAAVVAKHLRAAGADVTFSTVMGQDAFKDYVIDDLKEQGIQTLALVDPTRPTTNKNAIVVDNYRLLKVDTLDNRSISEKTVRQLISQISETPTDAIVYADFRHGIFNKHTIVDLVSAIPEGVLRVADSQVASRWGNILEFQGFDLITPNEREARFSLGDQDSIVRPLGSELYRRANCKTLMLKLGDRGMITFRDSGPETRSFFMIESFADHAVDPVGAGDALLAYSTLALVATKNEVIASILGSFAAGIECEHDGNFPVTPQDLLRKIDKVEQQVSYA